MIYLLLLNNGNMDNEGRSQPIVECITHYTSYLEHKTSKHAYLTCVMTRGYKLQGRPLSFPIYSRTINRPRSEEMLGMGRPQTLLMP